MSKPEKDWGTGIPRYTQDDVLSGLELHYFCANVVAQTMQDEGYTIDGIVKQSPIQVIAHKYGRQYNVIVAGDLYPYEGRISFELKKQFASFCLKQNNIPMFASVGLMSHDSERAEAGLALKNDGYYIKYEGNVDLSKLREPMPYEEEFKSYLMEEVIEAYSIGDFSGIYEYFDDDIEYHSQWVFEALIGSKALIDYFDKKGRAIRNSDNQITGSVVVINKAMKKSGNIGLISEPGKICALIKQKSSNGVNYVFISPEYSSSNKLTRLSLNSPEFFDFKKYYAYD